MAQNAEKKSGGVGSFLKGLLFGRKSDGSTGSLKKSTKQRQVSSSESQNSSAPGEI